MTIVQQEVAEAPILLNNPTFIADSLTEKNSIVVVSNSVDSKYRPIAIILKSDGTAMQIVDSNFLTSMYGKEETEFTDWINNFIQANKVLYVNKNKSKELESRLRVSFPSSFSSLCFDSIIHPSVNAVNGISDKNKAKANNINKNNTNQSGGKSLDVEQKAIEHFGTTKDFKFAGYMLPDGQLLDFSGAHWLDGASEAEKEQFSKYRGHKCDYRSTVKVMLFTD